MRSEEQRGEDKEGTVARWECVNARRGDVSACKRNDNAAPEREGSRVKLERHRQNGDAKETREEKCT